jgi:hypothetical protein
VKYFPGTKLKDQFMKKICLTLALAGVFVLSIAQATTIATKFSSDPALTGWQIFGDTNLFQWDSTNQNLAVTWDSSQPNSYFFHPLDTIYSKTNDFLIAFDLRLNDITVGTTPDRPFTFEIAVGLLNTANATNAGFIRGFGSAPNIVEFTYFPNDTNDFGATVSTLFISSQTNFSGGGFTAPLEMATNTLFHVVMLYTAANQTLHTTMTADGAHFGPIQDAYLGGWFDDFQVDAVSINSYSDEGQYPGFEGSILAHGVVVNFAFASPPPLGVINAVAAGKIQFSATTNWLYTLQRTTDLQTWTNVLTTTSGGTTNLVLQDTNAPSDKAFYRVTADLP